MHPHWQKRGGGVAVKNMALGARFQKLRGDLLSGGGSILRSAGGELNSQRGLASRGLAAMFFCKRVFSVATLLLIIHVIMYILVSLI